MSKFILLLLLLCCVLLLSNPVSAARILGVFLIPSVSHHNSYRPLMETLSDKGHKVVVITSRPMNYAKNEHPNLSQIAVNETTIQNEFIKNFNIGGLIQENFGKIKMLAQASSLMSSLFSEQLQLPDVQNFIKDKNQKFDLCIIAATTPPAFAFKDRFNCSLIFVSSLSPFADIHESFGNPSNPIAYPPMLMSYLRPESFSERLQVTIVDWLLRFTMKYFLYGQFDKVVRDNFGTDYRSVIDIQNDADMLFVNEGLILGGNRPVAPNTIYFFGMHIKPNKPLPKKIKTLLDKSKQGAIYLSLGSNVKSIELTQTRIDAFLEAFKELPYTVLWKWENDTLPGKPKNVFTCPWYSQQDVLAHPNIKLFITQGGQQSMEEAINYKVPLIGMPFFGDQEMNVKKMTKFGIGIYMDLHTLSKEIIVNTINEIMKNSSYRENIEKLSDQLIDQPQTSMEKAIWWTEYVLRHKGAKHLKPDINNIPFYQYFLLDVIAFILIFGIITTALSFLIISFLYRILLKNKNSKVKKE